MFGFFRGKTTARADEAPRPEAPAQVDSEGFAPFVVADHLEWHEGFPYMRWNEAWAWVDPMPDELLGAALEGCFNAWRLQLRDALGSHYNVTEGEDAVVISSLEPRQAAATVEFMEKTARRIVRVLDGLAQPPAGRDHLIVLDEPEDYYRFVSRYYPEEGEFAFSGGMHITDGIAGFYVTTKEDPRAIEPTIAHEMTHGFLRHLAIPLWLNEGLAVNTEHRISHPGQPLHTPQEMRAKHLRFWGAAEIQQFWSGRSFQRADEGNALSYDLARVLVEQAASDWPRFAAFARAADWKDGGAAAAREHYGVGLGEMACALLDREPDPVFEPDPAAWDAPERDPAPR